MGMPWNVWIWVTETKLILTEVSEVSQIPVEFHINIEHENRKIKRNFRFSSHNRSKKQVETRLQRVLSSESVL